MNYKDFSLKCIELSAIAKVEMNEENTKIRLVMPMLSFLGYSVERDVFLERSTNAGRIDMMLCVEDNELVAIEVKSNGKKLDETHRKQLKAYVQSSSAEFGMLTNGIVFEFYFRSEKRKGGTVLIEPVHFFTFNLFEPSKTGFALFMLLSRQKHSLRQKKLVTEKIRSFISIRDELVQILEERSEDDKEIVTSHFENRVYGCILGIISCLGYEPDMVSWKDNASYFAVNFFGEPLCKIYQKDKDFGSFDGAGRIDFFERNADGERKRDSRNLPVIYKTFCFSSITDVCKGDVVERIETDCRCILDKNRDI